MATISGKRFQITDGASSPTNLFPYTVTEAVYGLSTVLANTQSAAVSAAATSAASLYLPLSGGSSKPMTGPIYVPSGSASLMVVGSNSALVFGVADTGSFFGQTAGTTYLRSGATNLQHRKDGTDYVIYDASNFRAGTEYVSISGAETITGAKTFTGAIMSIKYDNPRIGFYTSAGTLNGLYAFRSLGVPEIYHPTDGWKTLYHSGNSNKSDVAWTCSPLNITTPSGSSNSPYIYTEDKGNPAALIYLNSTGFTYNSRVNNAWVRQFTIDSSTGNVGIGTPTPGVKLDVNGQMRSSSIYFTDLTSNIGYVGKATTSNNHVYLGSYNNGHIILLPNGTGNVGIGTDSPAGKLHVYSTGSWAARFANNYSTATKTTVYLAANGYGILAEGAGSSSSTYLMALRYNDGSSTALYVRTDGHIGYSTTPSNTFYHNFSGSVYFDNPIYFSSATQIAKGNLITTSLGADDLCLYAHDGTNYKIIRAYCATFDIRGLLTTAGDQVISSDINLKENLQDVKYTIEDIAKTRAVTFDWKDGRGKSAGSIAQDWKPLIPELVHGDEGNMTLAYGQIALVNSILLAKHETEQDKEIARLKARVKELETRLNVS